MTLLRNAGDVDLVFRDDSPDKRRVAPGETFTVQGAQHEAHVRAIPGVVEATIAEPRPARARKAQASVAEAEGAE